jgi:hypothetical protein
MPVAVLSKDPEFCTCPCHYGKTPDHLSPCCGRCDVCGKDRIRHGMLKSHFPFRCSGSRIPPEPTVA